MNTLGWFGIFRLGLVQTALGAIVVLTTSTLNRVIVVELALPAMLPGLLVGLHYAVQLSRPRFGFESDRSRLRSPLIVGGMIVLALGAVLAAASTALMARSLALGLPVALGAFVLVGLGVGAAGTSLLALLATAVAPSRRAPAASAVWLMMIAGFVITAASAGRYLDPFSLGRLVLVTSVVSALSVSLTAIALWGVERSLGRRPTALPAGAEPERTPFREVLRAVWREDEARAFTVFVFVSMLAYSTQDLILEPYAGRVFGLSPGKSTQLAGTQHGGVFVGMLLVALAAGGRGGGRFGSLRAWTIGGCAGSAVPLALLAVSASAGPPWPLELNVFALGLANGAFAVAAIGSMMSLAGHGREHSEGVRMGLWGSAQAIAFALGGFLGTAGVDAISALGGSAELAYGAVFGAEAVLFVVSAVLAARLARGRRREPTASSASPGLDPGTPTLSPSLE